MSSLAGLVRLHHWILEEEKRKLVELEKLFDRVSGELDELEQGLEQEGSLAAKSLEGTFAYAGFMSAELERRRRLRRSLANLEQAMAQAREDLAEAYRESKKFEFAEANQQHREELTRRRRDQSAMDELGLVLYRRRESHDGNEN